MIKQIIKLKDYNWVVNIFYNCEYSNKNRVFHKLKDIDCPISLLNEINKTISFKDDNTGFTYSNYSLKESVIVITRSSSINQFLNTISHECYHLICHITHDKNLSEEQMATLLGNIFERVSFVFLKLQIFHVI